jgi:cytochrome c peroxidase
MRRNPLLLALAMLCAVVCCMPIVLAQSPANVPAWLAAVLAQARSAPLLPVILLGKTPANFPVNSTSLDANGVTTTYFPYGAVTTSSQSFFQSLGTNGRTCFTCHQLQNDWGISTASILVTYVTTLGKDPIFAPVDGSNCPNLGAAYTTFGAKFVAARTQLMTKGNFRIFIGAPTSPQWAYMTVTSDPYGCETSSTYGINSPSPTLSLYRRPLPATNVIYTNSQFAPFGPPQVNIMWDIREPNLESQFTDATLTHAQSALSAATILADFAPQGATFQSGSFTGQTTDFIAGDLTGGDGSGALGGPVNLFTYSTTLPYAGGGFAVFLGGSCTVPDSFTAPCPGSIIAGATPGSFDGTEIFNATGFANATGTSAAALRRQSIARGEAIFNTRSFAIQNVKGLNDILGSNPVQGTCATCHNNGNVESDAFGDPKHLGMSDATAPFQAPNGTTTIPITADEPVFNFYCPVGSILYYSNPVSYKGGTYDLFTTTDPGRAWITGQCSDLGVFKVSSLRGIGARAPFFHNGSAPTMTDVVLFYQNRFNITLSAQDIQDLVNYLNAL